MPIGAPELPRRPRLPPFALAFPVSWQPSLFSFHEALMTSDILDAVALYTMCMYIQPRQPGQGRLLLDTTVSIRLHIVFNAAVWDRPPALCRPLGSTAQVSLTVAINPWLEIMPIEASRTGLALCRCVHGCQRHQSGYSTYTRIAKTSSRRH